MRELYAATRLQRSPALAGRDRNGGQNVNELQGLLQRSPALAGRDRCTSDVLTH